MYLDAIYDHAKGLVINDGAAVVIACQVFVDHKQEEAKLPFLTEEQRFLWLISRSRILSENYVKGKRNERIKNEAIRAAIHQYPDPL